MRTVITPHSSLLTIRRFRFALVLIAVALSAVVLDQRAAKAVNPPPDGGYAGGNTAEGQNALLRLSSGTFNTAVGLSSLSSTTTGNFNTALGAGSLFSNAADQNTATGAGALLNNTMGHPNTATGAFALFSNTNGVSNTANGANALSKNVDGSFNTAVGAFALESNTTGVNNTATGVSALVNNTTGFSNAATGFVTLFSNTTGGGNTANGFDALTGNTTGDDNTAMGAAALLHNITGARNTALGSGAGNNVSSANNVICIGADVAGLNVDHSCFIGEIFGSTVSNSTPVFINSDGRLGTITSSQRFKEGIEPMAQASETLFALKPVKFHYKKEIDPAEKTQFGLVAEDVERVNPDLVLRDKDGKAYGVRYDQVNAMLLNEFLKEHRQVETQQTIISELQSAVANLRQKLTATTQKQQTEIEALTVDLRKVSAQMKEAAVEEKTIAIHQPPAKSRNHRPCSVD